MLAAAVEGIAAILTRQRMLEQAARRRLSRDHECGDGREILAGRLFGPDAVGQWLKAQRPGASFMALHAADPTRPLDEKHRLDPRAIDLEVERRPGARFSTRLLGDDMRPGPDTQRDDEEQQPHDGLLN